MSSCDVAGVRVRPKQDAGLGFRVCCHGRRASSLATRCRHASRLVDLAWPIAPLLTSDLTAPCVHAAKPYKLDRPRQ